MVGDVLVHYWDLGSIPRSPIISNIFFLNVFLCRSSNNFHHTPPPSAGQVSMDADLKVQKASTPYSGVSACVGDPRKSNELKLNGP